MTFNTYRGKIPASNHGIFINTLSDVTTLHAHVGPAIMCFPLVGYPYG